MDSIIEDVKEGYEMVFHSPLQEIGQSASNANIRSSRDHNIAITGFRGTQIYRARIEKITWTKNAWQETLSVEDMIVLPGMKLHLLESPIQSHNFSKFGTVAMPAS